MTQRWQVKCFVDTVKAAVPFHAHAARIKDKLLGYQREPAKDTNTIRDGLSMIEWLGDIRGSSLLEVGTGWQPMIPILYSLSGAKVYTTDLHPLIRQDTFGAALEAIGENRKEIMSRLHVTAEAMDRAVRPAATLDEKLKDRVSRAM